MTPSLEHELESVPQSIRPSQDAVKKEIAQLTGALDDKDSESIEKSIGYACKANQLYEAGEARTEEAAVTKVLGAASATGDRRQRMTDLAQQLDEAHRASDLVRKLAAAVICQTTGK